MIRYSFVGKKPNNKQNDEVEEYLRDKDFMKILLMALTYYIQGYHGDYCFNVIEEGGIKKIKVTLY